MPTNVASILLFFCSNIKVNLIIKGDFKMKRIPNVLNKCSLIVLLVIFLLGTTSWRAFSEIHYVSPNGNLSWVECIDRNSPCSPVTAMANAVAGDTVIFLDGTYRVAWSGSWNYPTLYPAHDGTQENPIIFKAENPLLAIMEGQGGGNHIYATQTIGCYHNEWIVWDGFKLTAITGGFGRAKFNGANNCTIQNCEFVGQTVATGNDNVDAIRADNCNYLTFKNNYVHDYVPGDELGENLSGTKTYGVKHSIFELNTFENCQGGSAILEKQGGYYNIYRLNFIKNAKRGFYTQANTKDNEYHKVYQNIFINTSSGAVYKPSGASHAANGMEVYNNTMYNTKGFSYGGLGDWSFWNNIFSNTEGNYPITGVGSNGDPEYSNYNLFYTGQAFMVHKYHAAEAAYTSLATWQVSKELKNNSDPDLHSIYGDPGFVNAGGTSPEDYKRTSYPTNGRGGSYASVMGAYITGNEVIGYSGEGVSPPSSPPSSPPDFSTK